MRFNFIKIVSIATLSLFLAVSATASNGDVVPAAELDVPGLLVDTSVSVLGGQAVAVTQSPNQLHVLNTSSQSVARSCDLSAEPAQAVIRGADKAYVSLPNGGEQGFGAIAVIALSNCSTVKTLEYALGSAAEDAAVDVDEFGKQPFGMSVASVGPTGASSPHGLAANVGPGQAIVAGTPVTVYGAVVFDTGSDAIVAGASEISEVPAQTLACDDTGYVVHRTKPGLVTVLDLETGEVENVLQVGNNPTSIMANAACTTAWVANSGDGSVSVLDIAGEPEVTNSIDIAGDLPITDTSINLALNESTGAAYAYVPGFNLLQVLTPEGNLNTVRTAAGQRIGAVAVTPGDAFTMVAVGNRNGSKLQWFRTTDL